MQTPLQTERGFVWEGASPSAGHLFSGRPARACSHISTSTKDALAGTASSSRSRGARSDRQGLVRAAVSLLVVDSRSIVREDISEPFPRQLSSRGGLTMPVYSWVQGCRVIEDCCWRNRRGDPRVLRARGRVCKQGIMSAAAQRGRTLPVQSILRTYRQ